MPANTPQQQPIPADFALEAQKLLGGDGGAALLAALDSEPTLSISLNEAKCRRAGIEIPPAAERVSWASHGFYLKSRPRFTFDPLMHAGAYYVEEPSSMFVEQAFKVAAADIAINRALDLCAAPGGKTLLLREAMAAGGLLVANEPIAKRTAVLAENVAKWGNAGVAVTCNYPQDFAELTEFFDLIAADVPCSGEGMFRKDHAARGEWSLAAVADCAKRQRQIIADSWAALRTGGYLIYSTCTFNREEDEQNVAWIVGNLGAEIVPIPAAANFLEICGDTAGSLPVYHFFPHKARGEGFFLALLRKTAATATTPPLTFSKHKPASCTPAKPGVYAEWIVNPQDFSFVNLRGGISAIARGDIAGDIIALSDSLNIVSAGVEVCSAAKPAKTNARRKPGAAPQPTPSPALAFSRAFCADAFPTVSLSYSDAIKYLRGEALQLLSAELPRGRVCVSYHNLPLGFANNVGTRLNNAYPESWRIRSTYAPAEPPKPEF